MKNFKKIAGILLTAGILTTSLPVYAAAAAIGDLNGDDAIDKADVELFAQYFAGWTTDKETETKIMAAGDVNGDGDVSRADAMELARSVDGWDGFTPMEEKIYTKSLEAERVQTSELTYNGETYEGMYVDNEIIIIIDENSVDRTYVETLAEEYAGEIVGQIPTVGFYQVLFETAMTAEKLEEICGEIKLREYVEEAYLNTVFEYETSAYHPNDPFDSTKEDSEYYLWNTSSATWHLRACSVPEAWELVKEKNSNPSIKIGILDTLFDDTHPDLTNLTIQHYADKDITAKKYPEYAEHGTHVAGIIGADINNAKGVAGVALGAELIGRAIYNGSLFGNATHTSISKWAEDIVALIEADCNIINISLNGGNDSKNSIEKHSNKLEAILKDLISDQKKFLLVATSGNRGDIAHNANYNSIFTKIDDPILTSRIIVVGNATYSNGNYRDFSSGFERAVDSSYIGNRVDIMGPGTHIYSTIPEKANSTIDVTGYDRKSGTSMASPFVAGVAALVWEANPYLTPEMVKEIICETETIPVTDSEVGMVNAEAAVKKAISSKPVTGHIIDEQTGGKIAGAAVTLYNEASEETAVFTSDDRGYVNGFTDSDQIFTNAKITAAGYEDTVVAVHYYINNNYSLGEIKMPPQIIDSPFAYTINPDGRTVTITGYTGDGSGDLVIPSKIDGYTVTGIGDNAFYGCSGFTGSLTIPDSVISIGYAAFYSTGFSSVHLSDNIQEIPVFAFGWCRSLTDIILPEYLESISCLAFAHCEALTTIIFPPYLEKLGRSAFLNSELKTAYFRGNAPSEWGTYIGYDANQSLLSKYALPEGTTIYYNFNGYGWETALSMYNIWAAPCGDCNYRAYAYDPEDMN